MPAAKHRIMTICINSLRSVLTWINSFVYADWKCIVISIVITCSISVLLWNVDWNGQCTLWESITIETKDWGISGTKLIVQRTVIFCFVPLNTTPVWISFIKVHSLDYVTQLLHIVSSLEQKQVRIGDLGVIFVSVHPSGSVG